MSQKVRIAKGQDWTIEWRVRAGNGSGEPISVKLTEAAIAGATSLIIDSRHAALSDGDSLIIGEMLVVLDDDCAAGDTTLSVTATTGPLRTGDILEKLQDLSGYTIQMEVLSNRGDATPAIAAGSITINLPTQTGEDVGKVQATGLAATTTSLEAKTYFGALWRQNSGSKRPLAEIDFELVEAGFL